MDLFIGKKLIKRNVPKHDYLLDSDIDTFSGKLHAEISSPVSLNHKWGLVVRMNDIDSLIYSKPDFVEVHLTSSDVNRDATYNKKYPYDLVVHGPEYNEDLLLDLSNLDDNVRTKSIEFFNKAQPLTTRMHQLELIPGLGKKHMWEIIEKRQEKPFESFADIKNRVKLMPDPEKAIVKRIIEEILGNEKHKFFAD